MTTKFLLKDTDNTIKLDNLRNADDEYINDATTVTADITDASGVALGTQITLTLKAGSTTGQYRGVLDKAVAAGITVGEYYDIEYNVTAPGGLELTRTCKYVGAEDTC